ncbi:MAG TPA: hypothetical protein VEF03_02050 [Candidatus Binataceae bacterium]|nr:hypothetical protein [Candidatus Binataceae bacterium]
MGAKWKMPPIVKIYEAIGALGDGRVTIVDDTHALVASSDASKVYEVEVSDDGRIVSSNDNASYWQGYLGYPGIAVLIMRGILPRPSDEMVQALTGIEWKRINAKFRNDYEKTLAEVDARIADRGGDTKEVRAQAEAALRSLKELEPEKGARRRPPASGASKQRGKGG